MILVSPRVLRERPPSRSASYCLIKKYFGVENVEAGGVPGVAGKEVKGVSGMSRGVLVGVTKLWACDSCDSCPSLLVHAAPIAQKAALPRFRHQSGRMTKVITSLLNNT
jgi:hypothetical protein